MVGSSLRHILKRKQTWTSAWQSKALSSEQMSMNMSSTTTPEAKANFDLAPEMLNALFGSSFDSVMVSGEG